MELLKRALDANADQSEEDKKLAKHVRDKVDEIRASASRIAHEGIWMTNIAYLLGYDGVTFNSQTRSFQPVSRASSYLKKNRIHVNKILPTIQNRLARLCKNPPKYDVRPESNDTEDKEAGRLGLQILGALWERMSLDEKRIPLYMWAQETGLAWMKVLWDTELGEYMVDPETKEGDFEGDVNCEVTSPFEIFPNPDAKSFEELKRSWLIHCKTRKLDYFKDRYPEKGHLVKEEGVWLLSLQYENRINTMNTRGPSSGVQDQVKNSAIEMVKYEARSRDYPNGRMITTANGILLENKPLPVGEIPFAMFADILVGGKLIPESIITHMRPIQDNYNENKRRQSEWMKKYISGKYAVPRGAGLTQESLNDSSDEVVLYDTVPNSPEGGRPVPLAVPSLPQWAFQMQEADAKDMNDTSGISEVSQGNMPSASIPAIGMQLLTEQDDTRIGVTTEQHEHAWARVGSLILKYVENFYVMPRKLKIAGKQLQYTVKEVSGEDLRGNTDVYVIRGSTLPGSKVLKRQEIINMHQQGYLGNPQDPKVLEKVLAQLEFGDIAECWEDHGLDMAQIEKGIKGLEQGQPFQFDEGDNFELWITELNRYRKGDKFQSLDPQLKDLIMKTREDAVQGLMKRSNMPLKPPPHGDPSMEGTAGHDAATQAAEAAPEQDPGMAGAPSEEPQPDPMGMPPAQGAP